MVSGQTTGSKNSWQVWSLTSKKTVVKRQLFHDHTAARTHGCLYIRYGCEKAKIFQKSYFIRRIIIRFSVVRTSVYECVIKSYVD